MLAHTKQLKDAIFYERMKNQKSIVFLPSVDFTFLTQLPQQLAKQFAKNGWFVIYLNKTIKKDIYFENVEDNLYICHDYIRFMEDCEKCFLEFDVRYVNVPDYVSYQYPKAKINLFYLLDYFPYWETKENLAFEKSDIVLTTAELLHESRKTEYKHPEFYLVKTGVPESYLKQKANEPTEFKNLKRPIISFVGSIGSWVDTDLMKKVAEKYTTVFIGEELEKKCPDNVINLGYIDNKYLFDYYAFSDVGLIPFNAQDDITLYSCPIKTFEYLGAGIPVVATKWKETEIYPDMVFPSTDENEFMANIEKALLLNKNEFSQKAKEEMKNHTWEKRYLQIEKIINNYCNRKA